MLNFVPVKFKMYRKRQYNQKIIYLELNKWEAELHKFPVHPHTTPSLTTASSSNFTIREVSCKMFRSVNVLTTIHASSINLSDLKQLRAERGFITLEACTNLTWAWAQFSSSSQLYWNRLSGVLPFAHDLSLVFHNFSGTWTSSQ